MTTTHTVGSGDDLLTYDVHGDLADASADEPVLFVFGSPMDASGFADLLPHLADRTVVTFDPRGTGRNPSGTGPITADQHAEDLHTVIDALGVGAVDAFGSSGGGVNLLRLLELHPGDVRMAVSHEPPTVALLPDRDGALKVLADMAATYEASGNGPAMAKFIALVMHSGQLDDAYLAQPAPDPSMFGMSSYDDGDRSNPLLRNMPSCNEYAPDVDALKTLGDRLVIGVGAESQEELAARGGRSVAAAVGVPVTAFPGGHGGFSAGGPMNPGGDPAAFAATLLGLLD